MKKTSVLIIAALLLPTACLAQSGGSGGPRPATSKDVNNSTVGTLAPGYLPSQVIGATVTSTVVSVVDRGGTLTTSGATQLVAASNPARRAMRCQNPADATENLYLAIAGAATVKGAGNFADLAPGQSADIAFANTVFQGAVQFNAATAGHRILCTELSQ